MAAQAEILKGRIRRMIVRDGGVYVEVYGSKVERVLEHTRSGVLTVSNLVELIGIEPTTSTMPLWRSPN